MRIFKVWKPLVYDQKIFTHVSHGTWLGLNCYYMPLTSNIKSLVQQSSIPSEMLQTGIKPHNILHQF